MDSISERNSVYQSLKADGIAIALQVTKNGIYNPSVGEITNSIETHYSYGLITSYSTKEIDGSLIKQGDKKVLLAATNTMPQPTQDDSLIINGVSWSIVFCDPLAPIGIALLYKIQARR